MTASDDVTVTWRRRVDTLSAAGVELVSPSVTFTHEGSLHVLTASRTAHTGQRHTLVHI